jgi:hypothetical protein
MFVSRRAEKEGAYYACELFDFPLFASFFLSYRCVLVYMILKAMASSDNSSLKDSEATDPTLFCTAYKRNRFYIFSKREPDS